MADIASYELAAQSRDPKRLDAYSYRQDAIYKELATVEHALLMIESGDAKAARAKLAMITKESPLYPVSTLLLHYGAK